MDCSSSEHLTGPRLI